MAKRSLRLALVAEGAAGVQVMQGLTGLKPLPQIVAVLTRTAPGGAERPVVHQAAQELGLDVWPSDTVTSAQLGVRLREAEVDLLLNIHSLLLIHPSVLAAPTIGSFNLHPGPLPEYAGLNVPSWAIYEGESSHGITVHWMDEGVDTGPIAWQERFPIEEGDTGLSVSGKCIRLGLPLILKLASLAAQDPGQIPRVAQDLTRRGYFSAGPPRDGQLDWSETAAAILRFVRAADYAPFRSPWGHPTAMLVGHRVGIAKAAGTGVRTTLEPGAVVEVNDSGAVVATGDELILLQRLWLKGRYVKPGELLRDYRGQTWTPSTSHSSVPVIDSAALSRRPSSNG